MAGCSTFVGSVGADGTSRGGMGVGVRLAGLTPSGCNHGGSVPGGRATSGRETRGGMYSEKLWVGSPRWSASQSKRLAQGV